MVEQERPVNKLKEDLKGLARENARLEEFVDRNLNYLKPRVRRWLREGIEFAPERVLTDEEVRMVKFYSGLNGEGKTHSLAETAAFLGRPSQSKELIGLTLRYCWIKLKRRELIGPEAIETLKLPGLIYLSLRRRGIERFGEISSLSEEEIRGICGTEWGLEQLREAIQSKGIDWHPEVEFPLFAAKSRGY